MKQNVKIAKELIKLAKSLIAFTWHSEYQQEVNKNYNFVKSKLDSYISSGKIEIRLLKPDGWDDEYPGYRITINKISKASPIIISYIDQENKWKYESYPSNLVKGFNDIQSCLNFCQKDIENILFKYQ